MAQKKKAAAGKKRTGDGKGKKNTPSVAVRGRPFKIVRDSLGRSYVYDKRTGKRATKAQADAYRARLERERQGRKRRESKRKAAGLPVRPKRSRKRQPTGPARGRAAIPNELMPLVRSLAPDVFTTWLVEYGPKDVLGEDRHEAVDMLASEILWKGELRTGDDFDFHSVREDEYGTRVGENIITHEAIEEADHTMGVPVELDSDGEEVSMELTWPQARDVASDMLDAMEESAELDNRRADTGKRKAMFQAVNIDPPERPEKERPKTTRATKSASKAKPWEDRGDGRNAFGQFVGKTPKKTVTSVARGADGRYASRKKKGKK